MKHTGALYDALEETGESLFEEPWGSMAEGLTAWAGNRVAIKLTCGMKAEQAVADESYCCGI